MEVLQGFDLDRWRPAFVIVERNYLLPELRLFAHMYRHGYRYSRTTGVNDWYVEKLQDRAGPADRAHRLATVFMIAPGRHIYLQAKHLVKRTLQRLLRRP